jgi:hypothetical protein
VVVLWLPYRCTKRSAWRKPRRGRKPKRLVLPDYPGATKGGRVQLIDASRRRRPFGRDLRELLLHA